MGLISEFKEFAMRGNVVDLAVGVIMGGAFGKIVNSLVADVLMPPIGYVIGGIKFTDLNYKLPALKIPVPDPSDPTKFIDKTLEPATINYGNFLQTSFDFLIIALCIFVMIKIMNTLKRKEKEKPAEPAAPPADVALLTEIRDLLKKQS